LIQSLHHSFDSPGELVPVRDDSVYLIQQGTNPSVSRITVIERPLCLHQLVCVDPE
jgi:hypothetical protein